MFKSVQVKTKISINLFQLKDVQECSRVFKSVQECSRVFKSLRVKTKISINLFQLKNVQECSSKNKNLNQSVSTQECSRMFKLKQKFRSICFNSRVFNAKISDESNESVQIRPIKSVLIIGICCCIGLSIPPDK